ncbi:MAG: Asp-tRNA(Asn)/Glu-tRNA(Gln) amidotransferase subunit GatA [Clostridia bacterium]|nr:Asp-tRNA(Asn)/Glu-tRNA(Gln) amidotransferase subunit GatA [Clostridia bacterium]
MFDITAVKIGEKIKKGELSAVDVTVATIDRINALSGHYNEFITLDVQGAVAQAERVQKGIERGEFLSALAGVPFVVKDNICVKGMKMTCASKMLENFVSPYDATVITRLRKAGAIILGKTNMDEFAMGSTGENSYFGATLNPYDERRVAGGSSSGSAVAAALREGFYSLGTDTGGSIRQPCAYCGVTGIKTTYGVVSRYGLVAHASSLEQIGPMAVDAETCAAVLDLICGKDKFDSTTVDYNVEYLNSISNDIKGLKIGVLSESFSDKTDKTLGDNVLKVCDTLKYFGAQAEMFSMPITQYTLPAYYVISSAEASSNLARYDGVRYGLRSNFCNNIEELYVNSRSEGFGDEVKRRILLGTLVLSAGYYDDYYKLALRARETVKKAFEKAFEKYDVILSPTTPKVAPKINSIIKPIDMYFGDAYTVAVNLAGLPAVSFPCGFSDGLPTGAQLIGPAFSDAKLLNIVHQYQQITDYHKKTPECKKEGQV